MAVIHWFKYFSSVPFFGNLIRSTAATTSLNRFPLKGCCHLIKKKKRQVSSFLSPLRHILKGLEHPQLISEEGFWGRGEGCGVTGFSRTRKMINEIESTLPFLFSFFFFVLLSLAQHLLFLSSQNRGWKP